MPRIDGSSILSLARDLNVFVNFEAGALRGSPPQSPVESRKELDRTLSKIGELQRELSEHKGKLAEREAKLDNSDRALQETKARLQTTEEQLREIREVEKKREQEQQDQEQKDQAGPKPENVVWIFGSARTGSTWLMDMLAATREQHSFWNEPKIGRLFGEFYESSQEGEKQARNFVLGEPLRGEWTANIRRFVLEAMRALRPQATGAHRLVIKEPEGTRGAPLLMEALPESAMVLLVRDPRDVIASYRDAMRQGGWLYNRRDLGKRGESSEYDSDVERAIAERAQKYVGDIEAGKRAYNSHAGRKAIIRYEDMLSDTRSVMRELFIALEMDISEEDLARVVDEHSWQNIPEEKKGASKFYRKGSPGSWREDLTEEQARIVEEITAPLLAEFYPEAGSGGP